MTRPFRGDRGPVKKEGPRVNREIKADKVRLIGPEGENFEVLSVREALDKARDFGLDLVEISPNAEPPVCKIIDYGKYKYEQQKKDAENRKKQKTIDVKEVQLRPMIDEHDYQVKLRNALRFLEQGNKVKVTLRFRGREMAHQELGRDLLARLIRETEELAKVESKAKLAGKQMIMVLGPK